MPCISLFMTSMGQGGVITTDVGVSRVLLPGDDGIAVLAATAQKESPLSRHVAGMLSEYFGGVLQPFETVAVDLSKMTPFRARILDVIRSIPAGETRSYGQVAAMAGIPRGARAVGGALAANPVPLIIPCHRIVAADGRLTGFTAPGGVEMKKHLLIMEGLTKYA